MKPKSNKTQQLSALKLLKRGVLESMLKKYRTCGDNEPFQTYENGTFALEGLLGPLSAWSGHPSWICAGGSLQATG